MKRLLLPFLLLALSAVALSACGDSESDEDRIVDVIETSVVSTDPADCEGLATLAFLEQTESAEGEEAVKSCEEDAEDTEGDPDSVEVAEVEIEGSSASAEVAFDGGSFDGQTLGVDLVEEDGDWKLDEITEFVVFDRASLIEGFEEAFEGAGELDAEVVSCIVEGIEEGSDAEVEELILGGSNEALIELAEECAV